MITTSIHNVLSPEDLKAIHAYWRAVLSETPLADRTNMVYAGTHISKGKGAAVVVATGTQMEIGQIAVLAQATEKIATPLEQKIAQFSKYTLWEAFFVLIGIAQQLSFSEVFLIGSVASLVLWVEELRKLWVRYVDKQRKISSV